MSGDRILLVEDDKEIREGVEIFLKARDTQYSRQQTEWKASGCWRKERLIWPLWM